MRHHETTIVEPETDLNPGSLVVTVNTVVGWESDSYGMWDTYPRSVFERKTLMFSNKETAIVVASMTSPEKTTSDKSGLVTTKHHPVALLLTSTGKLGWILERHLKQHTAMGVPVSNHC